MALSINGMFTRDRISKNIPGQNSAVHRLVTNLTVDGKNPANQFEVG